MHYSLTRATTWNILGYLYLFIAALISTPIIVRHLGLGNFAQYGLVIATLSLVSSLDLGLPQAVVRALSIDHEHSRGRQTIWATSILLFVMSGIVAAVVATLISYNLHVSPAILPTIFALALVSNLVAHYSTLPQAEGHFGFFNAKTFIVGTGNTIVAAYLSWRGLGLLEILLALLVSYLISLFVLVYFSLKFFPRPRDGRVSVVVAKSLITFGLKNQAGKLVGQAQSQYGKYLLVALSPLTLSAYVIAQGLVQKLVGGVSQVATAFYPAVSRSGINPSVHLVYIRLQLGLFALGLLGVFAYQIIGLPFLTWWLGDLQLVSTIHSFILSYRFYGLLLLLTPLSSAVLDSTGHPGTTSLFGALAFALELVFAVILLPSYGMLALSYAGIISLGIMVPTLLIFTEKILSRGGTAAQK